jgi:GDPmannose 4,6-dehydratase
VIATGESHSLEEFIATAFSSVGLDWKEHVDLDPALLRPTDITVGKANPARARESLGWQAQYRMADVVRMMVEAEKFRVQGSEFRVQILNATLTPER